MGECCEEDEGWNGRLTKRAEGNEKRDVQLMSYMRETTGWKGDEPAETRKTFTLPLPPQEKKREFVGEEMEEDDDEVDGWSG